MALSRHNPITYKRFRRFLRLKRASLSLLLLTVLYLLSLMAEVICNTNPLLLRHEGHWFFPAFSFITEDAICHNGNLTRADFLSLEQRGILNDDLILWAPLKNSPYRIIPPDELTHYLKKELRLTPLPKVAGITIDKNLNVIAVQNIEDFITIPSLAPPFALTEYWTLDREALAQLSMRWSPQAAPDPLEITLTPKNSSALPARLCFSPSGPRKAPRKSLRARLLETTDGRNAQPKTIFHFSNRHAKIPENAPGLFYRLPEDIRNRVMEACESTSLGELKFNGYTVDAEIDIEKTDYPFRPVPGHPCGIDNAGRDVLARIIYALRTALNFGIILVICSLSIGALFGIAQGLSGGKIDLIGQRLTELWSALPFLYIMILMGSLYGTGFTVLMICYALFNWIGVSYYMRAETLRIRKMPYIDAARCLGCSTVSIAFRHILPNALTPLVTLLPFSLVGAIGALAALDYLGFGVPPPSPSLGELLSQAQLHRSAWWLTLFPSLTLFVIMLLGVFIGEGLRNAFDSKQ